MILLAIEPLSKPVAIAEILILLAGAALIGWSIGRATTNGKIKKLRQRVSADEYELNDCKSIARTMAVEMDTTSQRAVVDNLKLLEGIGPKIEELLNYRGIFSFAQLSATEVTELTEMLTAAGPRFQMHDPGTWPYQASLARDGKWEELRVLQEKLDGGREA